MPSVAGTKSLALLATLAGLGCGSGDGDLSSTDDDTGTTGGGLDCGWIAQFGGEPVEEATSVALGPGGDVFVSGFSSDTVDDEMGAGDWDGFVGRWSADGERQWVRMLGSSEADRAYGVATDADGSVFVVGNTLGSFDGVATGDIFGDGFVVKLDGAGNESWRRQITTTDGVESAYAVATDSTGAAYVAGTSNGLLGSVPLVGELDAYVIKYDASGTQQWVYQLGTMGSDRAVALASGGDDSIFVAGNTGGVIAGQTGSGDDDAFIAKIGPDGTEQWVRQFGSAALDGITGLSVDSTGGVYASGVTDGELDGTTHGLSDAFLVKYDAEGAQLWIRQLGSSEYDTAAGLSVDSDAGVYLVGYADGSIDGQPQFGGRDMFVAKYDSSGVKAWTRSVGTDEIDRGAAVAASGNGTFVIAGMSGGAFEHAGGSGGPAVLMRLCDDS
jgi:hypothetical protein